MTDLLSGKTALVTGGALRLGAAAVRALAGQGADVVVHYGRSQAAAEELVEELRAAGTSAWSLQADLMEPEEAEGVIPRAVDLAGGLDILINSASIFSPDILTEATLDALIENMRVNAWAPLVLSRSFARQTERGAIVNFLDTRVAGYDWKHFSYIASKNALELWTRMMAIEFAPGIRVNAVAPGLILPPPGRDDAFLEALKETVPLKRRGGAGDIVAAVLFLLHSEFVTGQVIYVDGGRHLMEYARG